MRHQKAGSKFGRTSSHRAAMFSNMVTSVLLHERIETTEAKAKEVKRLVDRTISWGTSVSDLTAKGRDKLDAGEKARVVHAIRMAERMVHDKEVLTKLFDVVAPRFRGRNGGYTRVLKTRIRRGDAAPMAFLELVEREGAPESAPPPPEAGGKAKATKKVAASKAEKSAEKPAAKKPPRKKKSETPEATE